MEEHASPPSEHSSHTMSAGEHDSQQDTSESPPWTIEEVASELLSLYKFLIRAYLPEWLLRVPPPTGWPQITKERFAALKKDDKVIELLRHIPYIRKDSVRNHMIWTDCQCNDYAGIRLQHNIVRDKSIEMAEGPMLSVESHRVLLGHYRSRDGWCLIFDTKDGSVEYYTPMYGDWDRYESISHLCEHIKSEFLKMNVLARDEEEIWYSAHAHWSEMGKHKELLVKYGWPGEHYDKKLYLRAAHGIRFGRSEQEEEEYQREQNTSSDNPPYSIKHVAGKLLSFYQFLVRMYVPEDMLRVPPEGGWPTVPTTQFFKEGKTYRVMDLVKELPYIRQDWQDTCPTMIFPNCVGVDYSGQYCCEFAESFELSRNSTLFRDPLSEHKFPLATDYAKEKNTIVFDTNTGHVEFLKEGKPLRTFATIDEAVQYMQNEFTELHVIPVDPQTVQSASTANKKRKEIYTENSWPDDKFNKRSCLRSLKLQADEA